VERIPVIIDTDPGIDDFFAIMLANSYEELDIKAITTVAGNGTLESVTKNALDIAKYFHIDVEIAKGAEKPLNIPLCTAGHIHGENGLGNLQLKASNQPISTSYAWDVLYQQAVDAKGKLEIIAIGPLTNVAIALLKYPALNQLINRIVLMGGSGEIGNVSPYGEFNIAADPFAADIVFQSKIPLVMVGWDMTRECGLTEEEAKTLTAVETPYAKDCTALLDFLREVNRKYGRDTIPLSDALAVAYAINPAVLQCADCYVAVETRSSLNIGRTVVDFNQTCKMPANCSVGVGINKAVYFEMLVQMMHDYQSRE
jgi:pyrimidine-specific ribonucleoside hydrolase